MILIKKNNDHSLFYLLGLINSKLLNYFYREFFITIDVLKNALLSLPIKTIDFSDQGEEKLYSEMVNFVKHMLELQKQIAGTKTPQTQAILKRQIEAVDAEIDQLTYKLYGLTDDEIQLVESGT